MSIAEQVAEHLRREILMGAFSGEMPGSKSLAESLGVNHKTAEAAATLLEREGLLKIQGPGKPRRIIIPDDAPMTSLRVAILPFDAYDARLHYIIDLQHSLSMAGHSTMLTTKSLADLRMDPKRVARLVQNTPADAWIVVAAHHEVLKWFANQPIPTFAFFGTVRSLPLARVGPAKGPITARFVQQLVALGHHRIVMLAREGLRKPQPGPLPLQFLEELQAQGIATGSYNLPDWDDNPQSFHECLRSLFDKTPPTALLVEDAKLVPATMQFLARRDIRSPRDISLISLDPDEAFQWIDPPVTHLSFDGRPWVRRTVEWANNVARGKEDRRKDWTKVTLVEGGTIGPAPLIK